MVRTESLEQKVSSLKTELNARLTEQPTDYTSIISKKSISTNQYDFSVATTSGQSKKYLIEVTPASGKLQMMNFKMWYSFNADVLNNIVFGVGFGLPVTVKLLEKLPVSNKYQFELLVIHSDPAPLTTYFKFMIEGTDNFTYTITQI